MSRFNKPGVWNPIPPGLLHRALWHRWLDLRTRGMIASGSYSRRRKQTLLLNSGLIFWECVEVEVIGERLDRTRVCAAKFPHALRQKASAWSCRRITPPRDIKTLDENQIAPSSVGSSWSMTREPDGTVEMTRSRSQATASPRAAATAATRDPYTASCAPAPTLISHPTLPVPPRIVSGDGVAHLRRRVRRGARLAHPLSGGARRGGMRRSATSYVANRA